MTVEFGAPASMLLGMLGSPQTARELHALARTALEQGYTDIDESFKQTAHATLETLVRAGASGIHELLVTLEQKGAVGRAAADTKLKDLWWAQPVERWRDGPAA